VIAGREKHQSDGGREVGIGSVVEPFNEVAEEDETATFLTIFCSSDCSDTEALLAVAIVALALIMSPAFFC